ncbi:predicted protein [Naegleria gruberi]|uniref:Predicted protein n=1 Tax=Naegleria gruberi TaxID=5762 RepID=D2W1M1_NAEGR|nr:uncharacterized protein NAEGRDRAFT_75271 [Naegleria gruberi]EFC37115.1 predicted protein [Naegleria gruberi]|eukprot:XP_002669859.1 predicted protein [Naegleria gruberi strain NEG-M]
MKKLMKARGFTDQVVLPRIFCSRRKLMLKSIRNWFLTQQSNNCLNYLLSVYEGIGNYVRTPATLNENNSELVSEMIQQLTPNLFLTKWSYSEGPYYQLETEVEITITNIQGNDELTKFKFSTYHCDYNGERSVIVTHLDEETEILNNQVPIGKQKGNCATVYISYLMLKVGLTQEMSDSDECLRDFLISIYWNGTSGKLPINVIERDVFTISGIP